MPLPPDINARIAKAKANGFTDEQIRADVQRKYGVTFEPTPVDRKPQDMLGSNKVLDFITGMTGGKHVAKLGGALAFMGSKDKKAADQSAMQLDQMTQKYVTDALAKYPSGDPRREKALRLARGNFGANESYAADVAATGPTGKEVAADVGKMALTAVGAKVPANFTGKLALTRSSLAQVPLGAAQGALESFEKGGSAGDVARSAATTGLTAGVTRGLMGLGGRLFGKLTNGVPNAIYKTSTQMRRGDTAMPLLKEGVVGNRQQLLRKSNAMISDAADTMAASPEAVAKLNPRVALEYGPLKDYLAAQKRLGPEEYSTAKAVIESKLMRPVQNRLTLNELRQALDAQSPPGVFSGKAHEITSKTEGLVADALRSLIKTGAPTTTAQLGRQQTAITLKNAVEDQLRSKQNVPGFISGLVQRGILTPAIGTRLARAGYLMGAPGRALSTTKGGEGVNRGTQQLIRAALAKASAQGE